MNIIIASIAGLLSGAAGAMGLGGGGVLMIYLTVFSAVPQFKAQGINLLFFIPTAVVAVILYAKKKMIKWKMLIPVVISGVAGVVLGYFLSGVLGGKFVKTIFAIMLMLLGTREIFTKKQEKPCENS